MKLTRHNDVLNQLEGARKSLKATSDTVYHLRTEKNALTSEVNALKEELAYLLKMKEGTTPEGFVDLSTGSDEP